MESLPLEAVKVPDVNIIQPTPPRYKQHHRLLYRGSLSLPDSDLVLDGITFTAHLLPTSPTALLESPVALALESMRGRPSLRFVSCVSLADIPHECAGDISMYIHPRSTLTRGFFENVLCADCIGPSGHTTTAVRIGLGDGHGPEENDLLVFGSLLSSQSTLRMTVARVTPRPPPPRIRPPRPDDPAPRKPPILDPSGQSAASKRRNANNHDITQGDERPFKRSKSEHFIDLKTLMAKNAMFKIPDVTTGNVGKGKARASGRSTSFKVSESTFNSRDDEDVFGTSTVTKSSKAAEHNTLEVSNKTTIKKFAVKALAGRGMPKEHPGFRELFGWITRGVGFAFRNKLKTVKLSTEEVQRLIDSHVLMYFDGFGGPN